MTPRRSEERDVRHDRQTAAVVGGRYIDDPVYAREQRGRRGLAVGGQTRQGAFPDVTLDLTEPEVGVPNS